MALVVLRAVGSRLGRTRTETHMARLHDGQEAQVQVEVPDEQGESKEATGAGAAKESVASADIEWYVVSLVLLWFGYNAGVGQLNQAGGPIWQPTETINEFALFYVFAQALERGAEFVSVFPWIGERLGARFLSGNTGSDGQQADDQRGSSNSVPTKPSAAKRRDQAMAAGLRALAAGKTDEGDAKSKEAADAQHDLDVIRSNRSIFFFGLIGAVALYLVGYFDLLILRAANVQGHDLRIDLVVTALAIAGGTKPLHDLIKNIQKSKENNEDGTTAAAA